MKLNEYLLIGEAAEFLGVTENTLRNWEAKKKLMSHRNPQNKYRMYKREDLQRLLDSVGKR